MLLNCNSVKKSVWVCLRITGLENYCIRLKSLTIVFHSGSIRPPVFKVWFNSPKRNPSTGETNWTVKPRFERKKSGFRKSDKVRNWMDNSNFERFRKILIFFRSGVKWRTDEQNAISQKKAESDYFRSSKIIQGYTDPFIPNHSILLGTRVSEFEKLIISKYILGEGKASNFYSLKFTFENNDIGDGCWRRNELVTSLRCWWEIRSFWTRTFAIFEHQRAFTYHKYHQCSKCVPNFKLPKSLCHQHHCGRWNHCVNPIEWFSFW